jgi:2-phospho-L-lactate transferase/gluconeogenesis factor (CofD/UPF0052 family)
VPDTLSERSQIDVVLFSGGSGTDSITRALLRHPQIRLRVLINAYDDGHSTGRLRKFIPGMLGPSDVRKNVSRLMPGTDNCHHALKKLSDVRLPVGIAATQALEVIDAIVEGNHQRLPPNLAIWYCSLTVNQAERLQSFLKEFRVYFKEQARNGRNFDFTDCAIGNLIFAGCFIEQRRDFNRTIDAFGEFYEVPAGALLNATLGENLFLIAEKENGAILLNEADIVATHSASSKIARLYLIEEHCYRAQMEDEVEPPGGWRPIIKAGQRTPRINPAAADALAKADVIIYGPGTQHSSLFPSYMTEGVAESIAANRAADKIFVGNILRDADMQEDDTNDLARKFMLAMSRDGAAKVEWADCVTQFFVQRTEDIPPNDARYIPFAPAEFKYPLDTVRLLDWESQEGRHSGGVVLDEVQRVVQGRIDIELQRLHYMVSIVVPVLNEGKTIEGVLKSLIGLDFLPLGLSKEIIVVDGGSTDGSQRIAKSLPPVRLFAVGETKGRGAALRVGIEKARGNIIVFFAADREYNTADLQTIVQTLVTSRYRAVFGTRATKVRDMSQQLSGIYASHRWLYLSSKYGGILLSVLTLLLYNRYVSDVLTSVKGFDGQLLKSLKLECNGRDLETEIIAKLGRRHEFIMEVPVDYSPRTRSEGKKITVGDGFRAMLRLVRYRFGKEQTDVPVK